MYEALATALRRTGRAAELAAQRGRRCPCLECGLAGVERERPAEAAERRARHAARGPGTRRDGVARRQRPPLEGGAALIGVPLEVALDDAPDALVAGREVRAGRCGVLAVPGRDVWVGPDRGVLERACDELEVLTDGERRVPWAGVADDGSGEQQRLDANAKPAENGLGRDPALELRRHRPDRSELRVA